MISKPTITKAWRAVAKSGNEFVAAINCDALRARWNYVLTASHDQGILVVTLFGKPIGVVGSPVVLRNVLLEWRDGKSSSSSRYPEARRAIEEVTTGLGFNRFPFAVDEIGVEGRPSSMARFFEGLSLQGKVGLILWHKRVYAYLIPLTWLARYRGECGRDEPNARDWLTQVLNWAWAQEIEPKRVSQKTRRKKHDEKNTTV